MDHQTPPHFSSTERDRRWGAVRELMALAGIDLLVAVDEPSSRYLTGEGTDAGPTIFAADGQITSLFDLPADPDRSWVTDVRPSRGRETEALINRLSELGADRRIVAVTGLDPTPRRPRGNLNYLAFIALREWFPHTRWVGASQLMDEVRWRKSDEEIATIQAAARSAEAALEMAVGMAGSSESVRDLWSEMQRAVIAEGGDPTSQVEIALDPHGHTVESHWLLDRPLNLALLVEAEVLARVQGYGARAIQPIRLGSSDAGVQQACNRLVELWNALWDQLRPGRT